MEHISKIISKNYLMLGKKRRLILVNSQEIEFPETKQGRQTGQVVKKVKYTFFDRDLNVFEGYADTDVFSDYVVDMEDMLWDENLAHDFKFQIKIFRGQKTEQLYPKLFDEPLKRKK